MRTAVKVVLWVVAVVVVLVLAFVGLLWWGLSGGWDGIRPAAQPQDREVVRAREAGLDPLARLADPLAAALAQGGEDLGRADLDQCSPGQNNWKISDGYTLRRSQAVVVGAGTGGTVEAATTDLAAALADLGWEPTSGSELEVHASGANASGRYGLADDPDASLVVDVVAPGGADPYVSIGRYAPDYETGDPQPVLDAVSRSSEVTVLAVVERTYFEDD